MRRNCGFGVRSQTKTPTWWLTCLLVAAMSAWLALSIGCASDANIGARTDVEWLERGQQAPWSGFLLSKRMLGLLYEDAVDQDTEDTAEYLRDSYDRQ